MALTIGSSAHEGTVPPPRPGEIHLTPERVEAEINKVQDTIPGVRDATQESQSVAEGQTSSKWTDMQETDRCRSTLARISSDLDVELAFLLREVEWFAETLRDTHRAFEAQDEASMDTFRQKWAAMEAPPPATTTAEVAPAEPVTNFNWLGDEVCYVDGYGPADALGPGIDPSVFEEGNRGS